MSDLCPVIGCFVTVPGQDGRFRVEDITEVRGEKRLVVTNLRERLHCPPESASNGFWRGDVVQDVPFSRVRNSLGEGRVLANRTLGEAEQVLVEFSATGKRVWVPFQFLRRIRSPEERLALGNFEERLAERFRLKNLAFALEHWNENTGALSHLEVDPLPHQLHLVHHILASGNLNWLIADDVGLGKTIEVGMLLSALKQRRMDQVLVVCPAGLTRQWQEELAEKFHMDDFLIYGRDFRIHDPTHWRLYPRVIASMDMLKHENHLPMVQSSGPWDVIVFDEAHRLSRRQWGMKLDATERYRLAEALRALTDNLLLLTATPHQGHHDRFVALLELLRPEWEEELRDLRRNPEILQEFIYRNRKVDVTDADGNFIFRGQTTRAIEVPTGDDEAAFDERLQEYVRQGYLAAERAGQQGFAIGFVMTTFRKLAASSPAAIRRSLRKRRAALEAEIIPPSSEEVDERFIGEAEERVADATGRSPFFVGELEMLEELIELAERLVENDQKLDTALDVVLPQILEYDDGEKLLIFTEYRGTQDCLVDALTARFGSEAVVQINGDMSVDEKREAVAAFETDAQFLVSTEAGGEGLNLHRNCHVMINYDLPWNPMRLVQRVGRLYRYGQDKPVVVFNLHSPSTLDARVVERMYDRIDSVVRDLSNLSDEYHAGLHDEIFGEFANLVDVREVLESGHVESRTDERIEEALERARKAHKLHSELLTAAQGYDPDEMASGLPLGIEHLRTFVVGMLEQLGCELRGTTHSGEVVEVLLTEELANRLGRPRTTRLTWNRRFQSLRDVDMMDFGSPLLRLLVKEAKRHSFDGDHATIVMDQGRTLVTGILRWQDGQGRVMREEYAAALVHDDGTVTLNPSEVSDWLSSPRSDGPEPLADRAERVEQIDRGLYKLEERLASMSNRYLHPAQQWLLGAAWVSDEHLSRHDA